MAQSSLDDLLSEETNGVSDAEAFLNRVIGAHEAADPDTDDARTLRAMFIRHLKHQVDDENQERFGRFLAENIQPQDFAGVEVEEPKRAAVLCELIYRFRYDDVDRAERIQEHVESLLKTVLLRFEQSGDLENMFELLQIAPSQSPSDPELIRLRSRAHLYEMRRAGKLRATLYTYMVIQAFLVILVFPILFINAENGRIQDQLAEAVPLEIGEGEERQTLSYADGLYWSIITATSIGYGDITPGTSVGRMIAAMLGTMGVLTIGVMAGLVLFWITPRRLD